MIKLNLWDIIRAVEPTEKTVRESLAERETEDGFKGTQEAGQVGKGDEARPTVRSDHSGL